LIPESIKKDNFDGVFQVQELQCDPLMPAFRPPHLSFLNASTKVLLAQKCRRNVRISELPPFLKDLIVQKIEATVMLSLWLINGCDCLDHILVSLCFSNENENHSCHFCTQLDYDIVSCG
jgi:hypothetical protein